MPRHRPLPGGSSSTERLHCLIEWLRSGERLTAALAADALRVSRRTVARDLAHLRDVLGLDLQYDAVERSYVLADEHAALPFLPHPSIAPALIRALPTGDLPDDQAERPPVHLRFSARAMRVYVARKEHPFAGNLNADGTLDLHLTPLRFGEFVSWVLSCGSDVEVIGPPRLRERVRVEIQRMLMVYGDEAATDA